MTGTLSVSPAAAGKSSLLPGRTGAEKLTSLKEGSAHGSRSQPPLRKGSLQLTAPGHSHPCMVVKVGPSNSRHVTSGVTSRETEKMLTCLLVCAQLEFFTHMVQEPVPRDWCCPQWVGFPTPVNSIKTSPLPQALIDLPTGQPNIDSSSLRLFPDDSRLPQVNKVNTYRSLNFHLISRKERFGGGRSSESLQAYSSAKGSGERLGHPACSGSVPSGGQGSGVRGQVVPFPGRLPCLCVGRNGSSHRPQANTWARQQISFRRRPRQG